jgi:hypothetical protein
MAAQSTLIMLIMLIYSRKNVQNRTKTKGDWVDKQSIIKEKLFLLKGQLSF